MMESLLLTSDEMSSISVVARELKFPNAEVNILYPEDNVKKLQTFKKLFMFVFNLSKSKKVTEEIQKKLSNYLKQYSDIVPKILKLLLMNKNDINFGKSVRMKKLDTFCKDNSYMIGCLISETFSIGRVIKSFNPDEHAGVV